MSTLLQPTVNLVGPCTADRATVRPVMLIPVDPARQEPAYRALTMDRCVRAVARGADPVLFVRDVAHDHERDPTWLRFLRARAIVPQERVAEWAALQRFGTWRASGDVVVVEPAAGASFRLPVPGASVWDGPVTAKSRIRRVTETLLIGVLLLGGPLLFGGSFVPSGHTLFTGGEPRPLIDRGAAGRLAMGGVSSRSVRWSELPFWLLRERIDPAYAVEESTTATTPRGGGGVDPKSLVAYSRETARIVALRLAGDRRVSVSGVGVRVMYVTEGSGLQAGDLITSVDGRPVRTVDDWNAIVARDRASAELDALLHDGTTRRVRMLPSFEMAHHVDLPGMATEDRKVTARTVPGIKLPEGAQGNSGGLPFALAMYQQVSGTDVMGGRHVVSSGTIDDAGNVFGVENIGLKAVAAERAGADVFVVPKANLADALRHVGDDSDVRIVGVATVREAVHALARTGGDPEEES